MFLRTFLWLFLVFEPVLSFTNDEFRSTEASISRKVGFTLSPDPHGDIAVSVYRASIDKVFDEQSKVSREETQMENDSIVYGSYVFFTEAGTSYCPHEGEERTLLYNAGTAVLGNGTLYAAKPEISTNTYEQTNVAPDKPAIFRLTLMNNADIETPFQGGEYMHLSLAGGNPDGAKVFIDGVPLAAGYPLYLVPGSPVVKTMEVYRGQADDYTDMELQLSLDDCPKVYSSLKFSVHFLPESSPVQVAFPRDKWVMNTLSARDSIGYYLPVTIDGFDIHHKNFDHIEFQYKLSTESDGIHQEYLSKPMGELSSNDFTRVIMVYDLFGNTIRFYAGTKDITDDDFIGWTLQDEAAPMRFGSGLNGENPFHGNIMEVRIWTKALSPAEIANTHLRRLTGYEHGLMAYYPMRECTGDQIIDLATGATLEAKGLSWTTPNGISLTTDGNKVRLQPTLFSRTEAEDYTFMTWFRSDNAAEDTVSLFGTAIGDSVTMQIAFQNGSVRFTAGDVDAFTSAQLNDGVWHHCVLVINKTYNSGALYMDNQLKLMFPTIGLGALSGTSVWLADGLKGNIDDVCLFEQALPAELIAEFGKQSPTGEEMGLINLLTFSCVKRNTSGVMEQVFSPDNQRVFRDANGNVVNKVQPLLVDDLAMQADKSNFAPVRDRGLLTNLPFNWTYQGSDLLININAQSREINKRTMYLTVRDVEDLNGNRLPSPVMWTVYANLNSVVWSAPFVRVQTGYGGAASTDFQINIINQTGMTRQYTIDQLPNWLSVSSSQGTLEAEGQKMIDFIVDLDLKPGLHNHVVYLTDDQGLSEPLLIEVEVVTECPYEEPETGKYPYNMSLCGQVKIDDAFDSDPEDKVIALYNNECIGMANVDFDRVTNKSQIYLTVFGKEEMNRKQIHFRLWQASTNKIYDLTPDRDIVFAHGNVYGCGNEQPVLLTAGGSERQTITLHPGWNWTSFNLDLRQYVAKIEKIMSANEPWMDGDIIKNPATRHFVIYSDALGRFTGDFDYLRYIYTYMVYSKNGNTMYISGEKLPKDSMKISVRGNGAWSALPCLFNQVTPLTEALTGYYDYATPGDLIKAHDRFATFSANKRWEGNLTSLRPGEGYLFRRMAPGTVEIPFYRHSPSGTPRRMKEHSGTNAFTNPNAATNMTMIAMVSEVTEEDARELRVFVGDELAAVTTPLTIDEQTYYFLTIQSNQLGTLRFEMDGQTLEPENGAIRYLTDSHAGSLKAPIMLRPADQTGVYKIIENNHVLIIRNNEKYDVTGKKL